MWGIYKGACLLVRRPVNPIVKKRFDAKLKEMGK